MASAIDGKLLSGDITIHVRKAQARGDAKAPSVHIHIAGVLPTIESGEVGARAVREVYACDASEIVQAMAAGLPGGTLDRVLVELMTRKMCDLVVPMHEADGGRARAVQLVELAAACGGDNSRAAMYQRLAARLDEQASCKHNECGAEASGPLVRVTCRRCGLVLNARLCV